MDKELLFLYVKKQVEFLNEGVLPLLTNDQRKDLFDLFELGFCSACGSDRGGHCYCQRDD